MKESQEKIIKKFEDVIRKEMSGILLMSSEQRFDMCENILNKNGKVMSFLLSALDQQRVEIREKVEGMRRETCNCEEEDGLGYHTKECDMVAIGFNDALDKVLKVLENNN